MIISRTPYRISFFGGGTDYPAWYQENGGAVLSTTINKYCYLTCRYLPPFFEHRSRIVWSRVEHVDEISQIEHPSVRETLAFLGIDDGVEIHHDGDLPARSGLGSSSAFTVGLLHCLSALKGVMPTKRRLAIDAIKIEQEILRENVGAQDQISAAFGGFNRIDFERDGEFSIQPIILPNERTESLNDSLMLFFTGISRNASQIAAEQIRMTPQKHRELTHMHRLVSDAIEVLCGQADIAEFGNLLHETWQLKRSITDQISNPYIDNIYETARQAGAIGGKLLGAGGGGFMLFQARPENQPAVKEALKKLLHVPIRFESSGSQIIFYDPQTEDQPARVFSVNK